MDIVCDTDLLPRYNPCMIATLVACAFAASLTTASSEGGPKGFLAEPPSGKGPGVLVLHPWWGLNADVKAFCKRLADSGFVAYAPDLFEGKVASTIPEAEALVKSAKNEQVTKDIAAATTFLFDRVGKPAGGISVVGFSFGAYYGLQLSNSDPNRVRAVVVFYGTGHEDFSKSKASYLGHFAAKDEFEPKAAVDGLEKALKKSNRPETIYTYPNTGHWFFEPSRKDAYNKSAAELAWQRTLKFLKKAVR
jgi:carboxymethylenebutenolidase